MLEILTKYFSAIVGSMFKFILGAFIGFPLQLNYWEVVICTVVGMMVTVTALTYLGSNLRDKLLNLFRKKNKPKRKFSPKTRKIVRIWRQYGMVGVAFLTPLFLTPPGGTLIALSFKERKEKIVLYMFISGVLWALILVKVVEYFGVAVVKKYLSVEAIMNWLQHFFQ